MIRILFVCHGNICRSPMAEFVMKDRVKKAGLEADCEIASAATSREELGNPVYPPAARKLAEYGIGFYNVEMDFDNIPSRIRGEKRAEWHRGALTALSGCELVFADPDNGLIDRKPYAKGAQKYILPEEIECYFKRGQQVVYYQHRPRINGANWEAFKRRILMKIPEARLLAVSFNRWSCRTYIFVLHENEYARYEKLIGSFLESDWGQLKVGGKPAFIPEII